MDPNLAKSLCKKKPKKKKDNVKNREWERRRRDKLNEAFNALAELLPNYDPTRSIAKIDILEKSTGFVKELRLSNSRLLSQQSGVDEKSRLINQLRDEVNRLVLRVKQLMQLLKNANIPVPSGPYIQSLTRKKSKRKKSVENAENKNCSQKQVTKSLDSNSVKKTIPNASPPDVLSTETPPTGSVPQPLVTPLREYNVEDVSAKKNPSIQLLTVPTFVTTVLSSSAPTVVIASSSSAPVPTYTTATTYIISSLPSSTAPLTPILNYAIPFVGGPPLLPRPMASQNHKLPIYGVKRKVVFKEKKRRIRKKKLPIPVKESNDIVEVETTNSDNAEKDKTQLGATDGRSSGSIVLQSDHVPIVPDERQSNPSSAITTDQNNLHEQERSNQEKPNNEEITLAATNTLPDTADLDIAEVVEIPLEESSSIHEEMESEEIVGEAPLNKNNSETNETEVPEHESITLHAADVSSDESPRISVPNENVKLVTDKTTKSNEVEIVEERCDTTDITTATTGPGLVPKTSTVENPPPNLPSVTETNKVSELVVSSKVDSSAGNADVSESGVSVIRSIEIEEETNAASYSKSVESSKPQQKEQIASDTVTPEVDKEELLTGDKISECIVRSMDLIDAPDGELMELGTDWVDSANSPKSPISPTQMFLSMFPLLPRESLVAPLSETNPTMSSSKSLPFGSTNRSSFFIDAMLPDEPSRNDCLTHAPDSTLRIPPVSVAPSTSINNCSVTPVSSISVTSSIAYKSTDLPSTNFRDAIFEDGSFLNHFSPFVPSQSTGQVSNLLDLGSGLHGRNVEATTSISSFAKSLACLEFPAFDHSGFDLPTPVSRTSSGNSNSVTTSTSSSLAKTATSKKSSNSVPPSSVSSFSNNNNSNHTQIYRPMFSPAVETHLNYPLSSSNSLWESHHTYESTPNYFTQPVYGGSVGSSVLSNSEFQDKAENSAMPAVSTGTGHQSSTRGNSKQKPKPIKPSAISHSDSNPNPVGSSKSAHASSKTTKERSEQLFPYQYPTSQNAMPEPSCRSNVVPKNSSGEYHSQGTSKSNYRSNVLGSTSASASKVNTNNSAPEVNLFSSSAHCPSNQTEVYSYGFNQHFSSSTVNKSNQKSARSNSNSQYYPALSTSTLQTAKEHAVPAKGVKGKGDNRPSQSSQIHGKNVFRPDSTAGQLSGGPCHTSPAQNNSSGNWHSTHRRNSSHVQESNSDMTGKSLLPHHHHSDMTTYMPYNNSFIAAPYYDDNMHMHQHQTSNINLPNRTEEGSYSYDSVPQPRGSVNPEKTALPNYAGKNKSGNYIATTQITPIVQPSTTNYARKTSSESSTNHRNQGGRQTSSATVNWMTDVPFRKHSTPFSVSKLVDDCNPTGQRNDIRHSTLPVHNKNTGNIGGGDTRKIGNKANYCAESLIRKNPNEWYRQDNSGHQRSVFTDYPSQNYLPSLQDQSGQSSYNVSSCSQHVAGSAANPNTGGSNSRLSQFSQQQNVQHFIPPPQNLDPSHHEFHNQQNQSSSVSNFYLSTIFPEINDKRNIAGNSNTSSCMTPLNVRGSEENFFTHTLNTSSGRK